MKRLFLLPFILILFTGCDKNKDNDTTVYPQHYYYDYINPRMKSMFFPVASYWVYRIDSENITDCTVVTKVNHGYYYRYTGLNNWIALEYHNMTNKVYPDNGSPTFVLGIEISRMIYNPQTGSPYSMGPLFYSNDTGYISNYLKPRGEYFDSLQVGNNMFYKVVKCPVGDIDFYTADKVGIVRKINHTQSGDKYHDLLRWRIK